MAENEQSGFHEGVTIPMRPVEAGSSIHTDVTVVMPRTAGASGTLLQTAVQQKSVGNAGVVRADYVGGYDLTRAIAKGGMGEIHLAKDGELKREVAVKVSTVSGGAEDPRFRKEAEVLANLAHPNIVPIYNLGVDSAGRLEAKMLPVPGTEILLSKTEFTVGEWKLYLKAEGLPEWRQTSPREFMQTDDHPLVGVSWNDVMRFCEWLSKVSGKKWRLPSGQEWESAVGNMKYPWGDYFPPKVDDGNFAFSDDGRGDPEKVGLDGVKGTAPVGSFKPNEFGFFDLGGNVYEMTIEGVDTNRPTYGPQVRGGSWNTGHQNGVLRSHRYGFEHPDPRRVSYGFRISLSLGH
jgi:hypothetical protein